MADLVDRQMVIDAVNKHCVLFEFYLPHEFYEVKKEIRELPSAQPDVPDIRVGNMISRQAAIDAVRSYYDECDEREESIEERIEQLPSADTDLSNFSDKLWQAAYERGKAEAVRHGHWIYTPTNILGYVCSECGKAMCRFNFCPHCGALMDEVTQ